MEVVAHGPLQVGMLVWRSRAGALALTVVAKATFQLQPGLSALAATQAPILERDELAGVDPARYVRAPADLIPYKIRADIVLVGQAYAPAGAQLRKLRARLAAFGIDKTIEVWCDRRRTMEGRILEGAPFSRMPIGWDRAMGAHTNPAGIPPNAAPDLYGTTPVPNVAWPDEPYELSAPAGLGPLAPWWPGRRDKLGRRGAAGWPVTWRGAAVPDDADDALFQVAPADQQVARLDLASAIHLENLHPSEPELTTRLAHIQIRAHVERPQKSPEPVVLTPDTAWLDADRGACTIAWRGAIPLVSPDEAGVVHVWSAAAESARDARDAPMPVSASAPRWDPRDTATVDPALASPGPKPLPFVAVPDGAPLPAIAVERSAPASPKGFDPRGTAAMDPAILLAAQRPLPFENDRAAQSNKAPLDDDDTDS